MVVELMASIPPRNRQFIFDHPKACPTILPSIIMAKIIVTAAIIGAAPIFMIFFIEKSSPKENNRNSTPMSAHV